MPSLVRAASSALLEGEGEARVEGRKRTLILVLDGRRGCVEREERIGVPSSPAPRTRMQCGEDILADWRGRERSGLTW